jgi:hypothetical protein
MDIKYEYEYEYSDEFKYKYNENRAEIGATLKERCHVVKENN